MLNLLSTIAFINPWLLAGLIFLPALWFLLRVTPPAPRLIKFPPARFLAGLHPEEQTVSHTPWWILLLRLLCAALVIVALARPVLNPAAALPGHGPVRLVIDNGWAAAQTWNDQHEKAASLIDRAARDNRALYILTTAPEPDGSQPVQQGPLAKGAAEAVLNGLKPYPWPSDYAAATKAATDIKTRFTTFWLSTGLRDGDAAAFTSRLQNQGELALIRPEPARLPVLLRPAPAGAEARALVELPHDAPGNLPVTVQALAADGRVLDTQKLKPGKDGALPGVTFDLPDQLRNTIGKIRIANGRGAGAVLLLDDQFRRKTVGIAAPAGQENNAPLIEADFYIRRALDPYADVITGTVRDLLDKKPPVIILPDTGTLPADEMDALEKWVHGGGLLLRFAGPNMTQGEDFLTPVPLRKGGRTLGGAMTWAKPEHIAPFPKNSPFAGLAVPPELTVSQQLLAEPVDGLDKMTWASIEDGTPLITARELDHGLLVLVHTTATPLWSDLALSGLFVQILQKTIRLAGQNTVMSAGKTGTLQPLLILDGFGNTAQPAGSVQPVAAEEFDTAQPTPQHPPGLYGRPGYQAALNLGARLPALKMLDNLSADIDQSTYGEHSREKELMPALLAAAFLLFMADWLVMMILQVGLRRFKPRLRRAATAALIAFTLLPSTARATTGADAEKYAGNLYLAYVRTGVSSLDYQTYQGLNALSNILNQRTSVETAGVVPVDPEHDELSFFPLIYWPVIPGQPPLSAQAAHNVQSYLDHGGTILFDTRDQTGNSNTQTLRAITGGLDIPPLTPIPATHVLTKSFYLLKNFPERFNQGAVWVEETSASGHDGVSSVVVGTHDWAADWATADSSHSENGEMGLRFGVNLVMYALTGNYKNDQVHINAILQRLGE